MEKNEEFVGFAVEARKYQTLLTEKYKNRKPWVAPNPKHILSHIPGTIVDILVKEEKYINDLIESVKKEGEIPWD